MKLKVFEVDDCIKCVIFASVNYDIDCLFVDYIYLFFVYLLFYLHSFFHQIELLTDIEINLIDFDWKVYFVTPS